MRDSAHRTTLQSPLLTAIERARQAWEANEKRYPVQLSLPLQRKEKP